MKLSDKPRDIEFLRANRMLAGAVVDFLVFAGPQGPTDTIGAALTDLNTILGDSEALLRDLFADPPSMGASRLPKRSGPPLSPSEALEALETSLDLMQIEVETLLREPWTDEARYRQIARRRDYIIKMMGHLARYYKKVIQARDPSAWTPSVEHRFEKFLRIDP